MADYDEKDLLDLAAYLHDHTFGGHAYGPDLWAEVEPGSTPHTLALEDAEDLARRLVPVISARARANLIRELRACGNAAAADAAEQINEGMIRTERRDHKAYLGRKGL